MIAWFLLAIVMLWLGRCRKTSNTGVYLNDDIEVLARVIRSEMGIGSTKQKIHVAWAARNLAHEKGMRLSTMVCSPCGPQGKGRALSSVQSARKSDRDIARKVLATRRRADPTGGATHFINPQLQDRLAKKGKPGYKGNSYAVVRRRWRRSYGWRPYYRLGATLELWGPRKKRKVHRD